ncbi:arf-GAP with Rho-GAP domain, ANK repeat and PH domain-containing protein 2 isoform X2 [Candoia aspera]|uniref:arf-GAP with Rho-GAP domain, ANK repeat and PH domain-containing protein 2 isoform X2 n=1 Tax=Candoia aspera TaxID=51853 RepID=UPI002FD81015
MSLRETGTEIKAFLVSINLGQYLTNFTDFGYNALQDCVGINDSILQHIGISPTGHRRRILKHLEAMFTKMPETTASVKSCYSRHLLNPNSNETAGGPSDEHTNTACGSNCEKNPEYASHVSLGVTGSTVLDLDSASSFCPDLLTDPAIVPGNALKNVMSEKTSCMDNYLKKGEPEAFEFQLNATPKEGSQSSAFPPFEKKTREEEHQPLSRLETLFDDLQETPFFEFKGEMVENYLYDTCAQSPSKVGPRQTRSFKLRHRPVPEIPDASAVATSNSSRRERKSMNGLSIHCSESRISKSRDVAEEKPPPISPYGETFLMNPSEDMEIYSEEPSDMSEENKEKKSTISKTGLPTSNQNQKISENVKDNGVASRGDRSASLNRFAGEAESSLMKECSRYAWRGKYKPSKVLGEFRSGNLDLDAKDQMPSPQAVCGGELVTGCKDTITPYACFYAPAAKKVKEGWLDKLSPQGKHVFQKRWVKFDGESMSYYNNDKDIYSKGIILLSAITTVRKHGDNKFEVVTARRIFVFRAEKEDERNDWVTTIISALQSLPEISRVRTAVPPEKSGYLELKGYKGKIFTLLQGNSVWICKNNQDFKSGYGITMIPMNVANVRQIDRTAKQCFEIITPYRSFSFTAESEKEKQEWIEVLQQSIAETLSDYEVAEKIWFNESNRTCADCKAPDPDWASINLCVIICKKCAGQHRSLGPRDSKVRSLKMDASIWTNELIELFIVIGNQRANSFWEGNLQPDEELHIDAPADKRLTFIIQKYKEGKFRKTTQLYKTKNELNKALCAAVVKPDVLETMMLLFNGADVMCATGDPVCSTPYLLAKKSGQRLQMEFLHHNKFSDFSNCDGHSNNIFCPDSSLPSFLYDNLYIVSFNTPKLFIERKIKEECSKRWCVLESGFLSYYENEKMATPSGMLDISEVICLALHKSDGSLPMGAMFTFEIYLLSERVFLFGAETAHSQRKWTRAIAKHFVPELARCLQERDADVIGQLFYKDCHNLDNWKKGWFALEKTSLYFCLELENSHEKSMYLRRLQELTISSCVQNGEKTDVLLLVEKGRTLYIRGHTKLDFTVWHTAIEKAAGTDGNMLEDQQLSKNDVPIIVNSCIAFVTQYGLGSKHIYLKNGDPSCVRELLECFKKDARSVKLRAGMNQLEDVTDTLKCFLSEIDDALLTKELYPFWISALDTLDDKDRVRKYSTFIRTLPPVNKATLAALMEHLYRVQKCSEINLMDPHNLAMAFSSCLFQTKGQTSEEVDVIEDLIINYVQLFDVQQDQVKQMDIENSFITKWKDTQISQAGDLLIEVYVERKEPDCSIIIRISPTMEAEELTNDVLGIKNITPHKDDTWATFEVIENGELERPLHCTENILEQILHWSSLASPSNACLIIKKFPTTARLMGEVSKHSVNHSSPKINLEKTSKGTVKTSYLKYKEEPSKLLSANKFQDRYFVLREGNLRLYKDMKSSKAEKVFPVKSLKLYLGVKKKLKPPTNWGLTLLSEKYNWYLCCDGQDSQLEWLNSIFIAQHSTMCPPSGKTRKQSITKNPKIGGLPLIPIQQNQSIPKAKANLSENAELETGSDLAEDKKGLKKRVSRVVQYKECKEEKIWNHARKHSSLICLEDMGEDIVDLGQRSCKGSESPKKRETRERETHLKSNKQLPASVIHELHTVLQRTRILHDET